MLIKDLPEQYKKLALANQVAQGNVENEEVDLTFNTKVGGFYWDDTSEGWDFWCDVFEGLSPKILLSAHAIWKKVNDENLSKEEYRQLLIDNEIIKEEE